jgi:hypothetical protein
VPRDRARILAAAWFLGCGLLSSAWCLTAARELGATFDEPTYVAAGLDRWRGGSISGLMRLGVMPLPVDVVSLPIWLAEQSRGQAYRIRSDGRGRVVDATDLHEALPIARGATLVFWWILLIAIWRLGSRLGGHLGGALAVTLCAAEPSLLGHASLATTDIAVCAFLAAFAVSLNASLLVGASATPWRAWVVPGVWFGLALLSKASALVFAPMIAVAAWWASGALPWSAFQRELIKITSAGLAVAFLYCGSDWRVEQSFVDWAAAQPPSRGSSALQWIAAHLKIFSNAGEGLAQQVKHNVRGHDAFVLGHAYSRAVWFYFPVVLSIKTSAGLLLGLAWVIILRVVERRHWPLFAAALIVLCSPLFRVQTGVRLILPVVPLAIAGMAAALGTTIEETRSSRRKTLAICGSVLMLSWSAAAAWRSWPDGLRYANELWGGTESAYRLVSDSNYDWGQGLPELRAWRQQFPDSAMTLWYWGTDPDAPTGPWALFDIRAFPSADEIAIGTLLEGRLFAMSATLQYGAALADEVRIAPQDEPLRQTARALRRVLEAREPSARTRTMLIYDFR